MIEANVTGDEAIDQRLAGLSSGLGRITRAAIFASLKAPRDAMKAAAPVGRSKARDRRGRRKPSGLLRRSIGRRLKKTKKTGVVEGKVGLNVGRRDGGKNYAPHAHLVALGTRKRTTKKGRNRGVMPANHFVSQSIAKTKSASEAAMRESISQGIEKELARQAKKAAAKK